MTNKETTFYYTYSATENREVLAIRNKYLPRQETKLEELKRLDALVQSAGTAASLCVGVIGCLVFGLGLCFILKALSGALWLGILLGLAGTAGMLLAYPVGRRQAEKAKEKYVPRILKLTDDLAGEAE